MYQNNPEQLQKNQNILNTSAHVNIQRYAFTYIFLRFPRNIGWKLLKIDISLGIDLSPQSEKLSFKMQEEEYKPKRKIQNECKYFV